MRYRAIQHAVDRGTPITDLRKVYIPWKRPPRSVLKNAICSWKKNRIVWYRPCHVLVTFHTTAVTLWVGSKGVINFPWIFYAMRSLVPVRHFRNISGHLFTWLVGGSFQWRHGLLFTDCIVWGDKDKVIGFKRSHWIHLGWWSTGSRKFQPFQLSEHSHVFNCRLVSSSAYFPWNMTLEYKMKLSEDSWDRILRSKLKTVFFEGRFFFSFFSCDLSLEAIYQSFGSNFRAFLVRTTKES